MKDILFDIEKISYKYPDGTIALDEVSLSIKKGSKIALLGANGAGKSTLLLHLNGTHKPSSGKINYKGVPLSYSKKELEKIRQEIGIVFQDPDNQLFSASVFQDVSFGPMNLLLDKQTVKERVEAAMEVTEVTAFSNKPTHALSYGQKKRVAIAGILAMKPEVIVVDEPTASLDPKHTESLLLLLEELNQNGNTIIMSTHNVEAVWRFADYIFILKEGRLFAQGTPEEIFMNDDVLKKSDLEKPLILEMLLELVATKKIPHTVLNEIKDIRTKEQLFLRLRDSNV